MIKNKIEIFQINQCSLCQQKHVIKLDIYRDIIPNDKNKDIRIPEFKKVPIRLECPVKKAVFTADIYISEDKFSKIIKIKKT